MLQEARQIGEYEVQASDTITGLNLSLSLCLTVPNPDRTPPTPGIALAWDCSEVPCQPVAGECLSMGGMC